MPSFIIDHTLFSSFEGSGLQVNIQDREAAYWPPSPGPYLAPVPLQTQNVWLTPGEMSMAAEPYKGQQTV